MGTSFAIWWAVDVAGRAEFLTTVPLQPISIGRDHTDTIGLTKRKKENPHG